MANQEITIKILDYVDGTAAEDAVALKEGEFTMADLLGSVGSNAFVTVTFQDLDDESQPFGEPSSVVLDAKQLCSRA